MMRTDRVLLILICLLVPICTARAQNDSGLNEIKGLELFTSERLNKLKLGVSTERDVAETFGDGCRRVCDFDENWSIEFNFANRNTVNHLTDDDRFGTNRIYPIYWGRLFSVILTPKKNISFDSFTVPAGYEDVTDYFKTFENKKTGVIYKIFDRDFKMAGKNLPKSDKYRKGDLMSIEYVIPEEPRKKMFFEEKGTPFYRID